MIFGIVGETADGKKYLIKQVAGNKERAEKVASELTAKEKAGYVNIIIEESEQF